MSLLLVGLSHHTAPVHVLERAALTSGAKPVLLREVITDGAAAEAVVLGTCNRIELYTDVEKFHDGVAALSGLLARHSGMEVGELTPYLYVHYEDRAVDHLFSVACGLDSLVVGEGQILGQLKDALGLGQELGTAGRALNELFQRALRVGKRAHSETGIDRAGRSLVSYGLDRLAERVGAPEGRRALVIGAGSMAALATAALARLGVRDLVVANRSRQSGERLAASAGGRSVDLAEVPGELATADLVVSCTGATGLVLDEPTVAAALAARGDGAVLGLLDLAMPRDIDAAVADLDGVHLVGIESMSAGGADAPAAAEVNAVRRIVAAETEAFRADRQAAGVAPTVVALRTLGAEVIGSELARLDSRIPDMTDRQRTEIAIAVHRVVDKLLHPPTARVKQLAAGPGGMEYADALRILFDLDPQTVAAVGRARTDESK
ncbi:glutamyl-tRNA reductase [Kitasatospora sp. NPDC093102]|uniref:glutamyl-tRNA reductase n=1 Tax=Kitasatospora sp. NPDC093102 TaxID=3155069 RepID=UPI0034179EDE